MIEPVELKDFFVTFFSAALVILSGAGYAGLITSLFGKLDSPYLNG